MVPPGALHSSPCRSPRPNVESRAPGLHKLLAQGTVTLARLLELSEVLTPAMARDSDVAPWQSQLSLEGIGNLSSIGAVPLQRRREDGLVHQQPVGLPGDGVGGNDGDVGARRELKGLPRACAIVMGWVVVAASGGDGGGVG
jgi:hypothetical protein